jgi:predicted phosphate transport protein (TIGR00153 family)
MRLFPKEEKFFDYFDELAGKIEEGSDLFLEMAHANDFSDVKVARLKEIEHEADSITHKTHERMHKTFLMPLDREDIYALVNTMDSIIDYIESTALLINLYKIKITSDGIIKQAQILNETTKKGTFIINALRDKKKSEEVLAGCVKIHSLENAGDIVLRTTIANLFENEKDAIELVKLKDIIEHLEEALDACEKVTNVVEGIILKRT